MPVWCLLRTRSTAASLPFARAMLVLFLAFACIKVHASVILIDIRVSGYDMTRYGGPVDDLRVLLRVDPDHDQDPTPDFGIYGATFDLGFGGSTYNGSQGWLKVGNTGRGFPDDLVASLIFGSRHFPGVSTTSEFPYLEVHLVGDSDALWSTDVVPTDASFAPHITGARVFRQVSEPSSGITRVIETTHQADAVTIAISADARSTVDEPPLSGLLLIAGLACVVARRDCINKVVQALNDAIVARG